MLQANVELKFGFVFGVSFNKISVMFVQHNLIYNCLQKRKARLTQS